VVTALGKLKDDCDAVWLEEVEEEPGADISLGVAERLLVPS
jgi:hypothetical protein